MIATTIAALYDRCIAAHGDRPALVMGEQSLSYRELGALADRIARGLQERGVGHGARVALLMANCPEYVACEYALARIGAVRVPLAALLATDDHVYMMNRAGCRALLYHEKFTERVAAMADSLEATPLYVRVGRPDGLPHGHESLAGIMTHGRPVSDPVTVDPEDLCGIYFTGGTTGRPKGVMLSHRAWAFTCLMELLELGIDWHERFLVVTPLTHAVGCLLLPVLLRGGTCIIQDGFDAKRLLETVAREGITTTFLVPTMIHAILDLDRRDEFDRTSLRNVIYGAAPSGIERLRQALIFFGPVLTQLYGQTEAPMMISVLTQRDHHSSDPKREERGLRSAGRPTLLTELRLVDDEGHDVGTGQSGEIVVRCPNLMSGYWQDDAATRATVRDGWLHTGDVGMLDEEGFLAIVDRCKDMIISGGFNVYPREVEDALLRHPAVKAAAVVGVADDRWGEMVVGVVVRQIQTEISAEELIAFVKSHKGSLLAPKRVVFWDSIPVTNLGKVDKKAIRVRLTAS